MTLLEALIASVILAVTAVVCLDATRGAAALQQRNSAWTAAVAEAESQLVLVSSGGVATGTTHVLRRPWRDGLELIEVDVEVAGGGHYRLARLVERAP